MITNLITVGLVIGILALGCFFVSLFRHEPWKALNIVLLTLGLVLLAYGHVQWAGRHESAEIKEAMFFRHIVAGWALTGTGFLGLQCARDNKRDDSDAGA